MSLTAVPATLTANSQFYNIFALSPRRRRRSYLRPSSVQISLLSCSMPNNHGNVFAFYFIVFSKWFTIQKDSSCVHFLWACEVLVYSTFAAVIMSLPRIAPNLKSNIFGAIFPFKCVEWVIYVGEFYCLTCCALAVAAAFLTGKRKENCFVDVQSVGSLLFREAKRQKRKLTVWLTEVEGVRWQRLQGCLLFFVWKVLRIPLLFMMCKYVCAVFWLFKYCLLTIIKRSICLQAICGKFWLIGYFKQMHTFGLSFSTVNAR